MSRPAASRLFLLAALIIFLAGSAIRLYDLDDAPLDFHPARQLHSALLARGWFAASGLGEFDDWQRQRAVELGQNEAIIEPPVLEGLVAITYRLIGQEALWVARVYSIAFWLAGGLALLAIGRRLAGHAGALISLLYFLVLPYAVFASRSFQPDPLMVALTLAGVWALLRWHERPGYARAALAGLLIGAAVLVKQVAVFPLLGAAAGLLAYGLRAALRQRSLYLIALLAVLPAIVYNLWGVFAAGTLGGQFSLRFFPRLWIDPAFYIRWANQIEQTVGLIWMLAALAGVLLLRTRPLRGLMIGWLAGYLVYGFGFAYHISTHDYYQMPLIPWVALGLAPLAGALWGSLRGVLPRRQAAAALAALLALGSLFSLYQTRSTLKRADYRAQPALWYGLAEQLNFDSGQVIGLFDDYAARLTYYGYLTPAIWLSSGDIEMRALAGTNIQQAFTEQTQGKRFFIVTHFRDFENQPELQNALQDYSIFAEGTGYTVYDLSRPLRAEQAAP